MTLTKFLTMASLLVLPYLSTNAQTTTQTIKGRVVDKVTQAPLPGANITVQTLSPLTGTAADANGNFRLTHIPVGKHSLRISFMGYKDFYVNNVAVISGKELVLQIELEEKVEQAKEITVVAEKKKSAVVNEMAGVSARTFSVEETQKFAAAVNDPGRMAQSFAGVVSNDDGNNTISIRGNAPNGLLWRMEGVDIPNPNHFSPPASSGGGISILSAQLLTNSDFMTGAFPAEYGNALSGVFDMKLRKGNSERHEHTLQAGFLGTDIATEGPLKKNYGGSYLANYRYSTLSILSKLGVNVGGAVTDFQDLSFNVFAPTRKTGNFSLFGFGGLSGQNFKAKKDSLVWENNYERYNWHFSSNTGAVGLNHFIPLNANSYIKSSVVVSAYDKKYNEDRLSSAYEPEREMDLHYSESKTTVQSAVSSRFNSQNSIKAGLAANIYHFGLLNKSITTPVSGLQTLLNNNGSTVLYNGYISWSYGFSDNLRLNTGVHTMFLNLNNSTSVEPRINLKYSKGKQIIACGYGLHSQMQPMGLYFAKGTNAEGSQLPNKEIGFTKAHHLVLSYGLALTEFLHLKTEGYYQHLYNVPVADEASNNFSALNLQDEYPAFKLRNNGLGRNYGIEITLEQFTHHNMYFLLSNSFFNSEYYAQDKKWRKTRYNTNFALSLTGGKEFAIHKGDNKKVFGLNAKVIYRGGQRSTPVNKTASIAAGETILDDAHPFSRQEKNYFRTDVKFSYKINHAKNTVTWSLDLQNATNAKNIFGEYFDPLTGQTKISYQTPLIPVFSYRIDF